MPGSSAAEVRARYGIEDLARLNWNEGLFGPLPGVLEAAAARLGEAWMYPEGAYGDLIESGSRAGSACRRRRCCPATGSRRS